MLFFVFSIIIEGDFIVLSFELMKRNRPHKLTRPNFLSFIAYTLVLFLMATIVANLGPNANSEYRQDWQQHY